MIDWEIELHNLEHKVGDLEKEEEEGKRWLEHHLVEYNIQTEQIMDVNWFQQAVRILSSIEWMGTPIVAGCALISSCAHQRKMRIRLFFVRNDWAEKERACVVQSESGSTKLQLCWHCVYSQNCCEDMSPQLQKGSILSKWDASVQDTKWRYDWKYLWGWFFGEVGYIYCESFRSKLKALMV